MVLLVKTIVSILMVWLASYIIPGVYFPFIYQPIILGIIIALAGRAMEYLVLEKGFIWTGTILDLITATAIVHLVSLFFYGLPITFTGALLTGSLIAVGEHIQHYWIVRSGRNATVDG
jgi:hypothetical protein